MATIQVRIDRKAKSSAKRVLDRLGIDMSSAIKAYFRQIEIHQGIPFRFVTENGLTVAEEKAILKTSAEAKRGKNVSKPMSPKEAIKQSNI